jgi:hypothetical protein
MAPATQQPSEFLYFSAECSYLQRILKGERDNVPRARYGIRLRIPAVICQSGCSIWITLALRQLHRTHRPTTEPLPAFAAFTATSPSFFWNQFIFRIVSARHRGITSPRLNCSACIRNAGRGSDGHRLVSRWMLEVNVHTHTAPQNFRLDVHHSY